jgi:hypothetical protein
MSTRLQWEVGKALRRGWHLNAVNPDSKKGAAVFRTADPNENRDTTILLETKLTPPGVLPQAVVNAWFDNVPDCNIGVDLWASGLLVIDIDHADGLDLLSVFGELEAVPTVKTARGYHLYYHRPADIETGGCILTETGAKLADVIGGEMYHFAMLPGSVHPDGVLYRWFITPEEVELCDPPGWLLARVLWDTEPYYDGGPDDDDDDEWEG